MTRRPLLGLALLDACLLGACLPDVDRRTSLISEPRLLAVRAEPAEARPGARVRYELLAVTPRGRDGSPAVLWSQCLAPKPSIENGVVSGECYEAPGTPLESQQGSVASGVLPLDACARFGPDPPPGDARPRDPDGTGGFYQPIILRSPAGDAVHLQRLVCNPRSAPVDVARRHAAAYRVNQNPAVPRLRVPALGAMGAAPELALPRVAPGAVLDLELEWRAEDAESYAWIDPVSSTLMMRREALLVSWFASGGSFATDRNEVPEGDGRVRVTNTWVAPLSPGPVFLWVVLRDSRRGTAFVQRQFQVDGGEP